MTYSHLSSIFEKAIELSDEEDIHADTQIDITFYALYAEICMRKYWDLISSIETITLDTKQIFSASKTLIQSSKSEIPTFAIVDKKHARFLRNLSMLEERIDSFQKIEFTQSKLFDSNVIELQNIIQALNTLLASAHWKIFDVIENLKKIQNHFQKNFLINHSIEYDTL